MEKNILPDDDVFEQIQPKSRKAYRNCWDMFRGRNPEINFEEGPPGEEALTNFFKYLRIDKKTASSSMWTLYSYLNSVLKRKYSFKLQDLPRLTMLIKGYAVDIKKKATIFDQAILKKFMVSEMPNAYWEVRQAVVVLSFFGGLRLEECLTLKLEQIIRSSVGYTITHKRCKQRSDDLFTKFVVPEDGGFAEKLSIYLTKINMQLDKFAGRVFYTASKKSHLKKQGMGRNTLALVPHELAKFLELPEGDVFTFHSFRRTSATSAADAGSTTEQLVDFFGWKNGSMCQEYISSSKPAILGMATRLAGFEALSQDPVVEVEVQMEEAKEVAQEVAQEDPLKQEMEEYIVLEEDPEMYAMAGLELVTVPVPNPVQGRVESTIMQAMSVVPAGSIVNLKIVVLNDNAGTFNFN